MKFPTPPVVPLGVKVPPGVRVNPVPGGAAVQVPPVGLNPVNWNGMAWLQSVTSGPASTLGRGCTVKVAVAVFLQPLSSVTVTV